jgi:hypothetical protein
MARKKQVQAEPTKMKTQTVEEWLAAGNKITICPPGMRSEDVVFKTGPKSKRGRKSAKKKQD